MSLSETIKSNPALKKAVHRALIPKGEARPRLWVKLLLNRFFHKYKKGAVVRGRTRMDVLPFNKFELGIGSTIEDFCTVNNGVGAVIIGDNSLIGIGGVIIGPVTVGNNVILAQHVVMSGLNHEYEDVTVPIHQQAIITAPIVVEDNTWIGANVVVTAGVRIGKHCIVGAGSVVTRDVPDFSVVAGNPAKVIKQYDASRKEWVKC